MADWKNITLAELGDPDPNLVELFLVAITSEISSNQDMLIVDLDECLLDIHRGVDTSLILLKQAYPEVTAIRYLITFDDSNAMFVFNSCSPFTSKLAKEMNRLTFDESLIIKE